MTTFLFYTFIMICLGILVRILWIPLMIIGSILLILLGITVCAGVTAFTFEMIHALSTDGTWTGFSTYFTYSIVFYTSIMLVYVTIVKDIFRIALNFLKR